MNVLMNKNLASKINRLVKKWRSILYLDSWRIDTMFKYYDDSAGQNIAETDADYRYLKATITFYLSAIEARGIDDSGLEEFVVHEMVHVLLAAHQEILKRGDDYMVGAMERETQLVTYALLDLDRNKI
jgi:hypothetical protein